MSYNNRNPIKRDNYGNRTNFNRNIGGGGGNLTGRLGGNIGGSGMGGGSGVSPWEGGMMPGGRGILPTPNNNLSLSSPQTQLAIASNLLTNILRNQQDTQPQVPSLLSLGNNYNPSTPHYTNQNYNQGNFNDRGRQSVKNRLQPYNKMGNRARDGNVGRRGPPNRPQTGNQRQGGNQRNDKSSKANTSKQNQGNRKDSQDRSFDKNHDKSNEKFNENTEESVALSEENEDTEEMRGKRDWKSEKKSDDFSGEKTHDSVKTEDESEDKDEDKSSQKKSASRHAESRYADVPISNMFCHVCNKHMWDGASFENHLRGRAHQLMMDKLDESYKLKVELMRHELRVAEEQRELTLTNSKRRGKKLSIDMSVREYCTMCDLNFYGTLSSHRKSEKHQQLKTFLHPRCFPCSKEFPSRIEYDEHCLTPTHMKNQVQSEEQKRNKRKEKLMKGESEVRTAEDEEKDASLEKNDRIDDSIIDSTDFITEIPDEPTESKLKVPPYKQVKANQLLIGKSMVKEVSGFHCEKCRRFMATEEDMNAHLLSNGHYRNFVQEIKSLRTAAEKAAREEKEKLKINEEGQDNLEKDTEEPSPKRAKLNQDATEDNSTKQEDESTKYDPEEANDDSEDENVENAEIVDNEENENEENDENDENEENENEDNDDNDDNDDIQEIPNDNESTGISINDNEDLLEVNDEEEDVEEEEEEKEVVKRETRPKAVTVTTPKVNTPSHRGNYGPRARGNRARRSRR